MSKHKDALDHYDRLYGDLGLSPKDAAQWVFIGGWNCCLEELMKRLGEMPLGNDTRASFAVLFQQMMHVDPQDVQRRMQ
jgi:hypothetical protein